MDSPIPPDPYVALGVTKDADATAIKKAYHKLALKLHPDKCTDESQKVARTDEFTKIQQAWDILGDAEKKGRYDATVKLAELRRQNMEMRGAAGPRDYNVRMAAPRDAPREATYSRMPQSRAYEQPPPRPRYYEDDYEATRGASRKTNMADDFGVPRKSPPREERREKTRSSTAPREEERKRDQRRRDAEIRSERTSKTREMRDDHDDRRRRDYDRRQGDASDSFGSSTEKLYDDKLKEAQRIIDSNNRQARPEYIRRESSRQVPNLYREPSDPRRSAAPPKDKERRRASPSKDDRRRENVDPYERDRRVPLTSYSSAPPVVETAMPPQPHRSYTTPGNSDSKQKRAKESSPPPFSRSKTQPESSMGGAPSSSKREKVRSRAPEDSGYSSPGYPAGYYDESAAPQDYSYSNGRRTKIVEPNTSSRRSRDVSPPRPSKGAVKMKGLVDPVIKPATSARRPAVTKTYSYTPEAGARLVEPEPKPSSSRRERVSERDREREREHDHAPYERSRLFGEVDPHRAYTMPSYEQSYSRPPPSGVRYTAPRGRDFERPSMSRSETVAY
jgi:curved DNA-binding protein CbpA